MDEEYEELDDKTHAKLIANVLNLTSKQHVKKSSRTEPTLKISEYDLVKTGKNVHLSDLTKVLKNKNVVATIDHKIKKAERKVKTLPKPLEKPQAERIRRSVAYEAAKEQLTKWDPVVTSMRSAAQLKFPLPTDLDLKTDSTEPRWALKSDMDIALEKLEPRTEVIDVQAPDSFPLTMKEMMERRKEMGKLRARQSYKESKARRQNKIKSKKYHRVQKRERVKKQMKEFEQLQKTDPEAALLKLEEIEKARAEERVSLRHKGTGKWARSKQIRAKYDKDSRQVLAQQLAISRDLTQKVKTGDDDASDEEKDSVKPKANPNNPWVSGNADIKISEEVSNFVDSYRKYWDEKNAKKVKDEEENVERFLKKTGSDDDSSDDEIQKNGSLDDEIKTYESSNDEIQKNESSDVEIQTNNSEDNVSDVEIQMNKSKDDNSDIKIKQNKAIKQKFKSLSTSQWDVTDESIETDVSEAKKNKLNFLSTKKKKMLVLLAKNKEMPVSPTKNKETPVSPAKNKETPASPTKNNKTPDLPTKNKSVLVSPPQNNKTPSKNNKTTTSSTKNKKTLVSLIKNSIKNTESTQNKLSITENSETIVKDDDAEEKNIETELIKLENKLERKLQEKLKKINHGTKKTKKKKNQKLKTKETYKPDLSINKSVTRPIIDEELNETNEAAPSQSTQNNLKQLIANDVQTKNDIDPNKFMQVKPKRPIELSTDIPDLLAFDDNEENDNQKAMITEAFQDDDIADEFNKEKRDEIKNSMPKSIDLSLPGWGSWGGKDLPVTKRKRRRFINRPPKPPLRKDRNKGGLIINENDASKAKPHLVSEVPFPFKSVKDYEASIRAPIGNTFVPETAFRKLIEPAIITKMGTVIEPMTEDVLLRKRRR